MRTTIARVSRSLLAAGLLWALGGPARADIDVVQGPAFAFAVKKDHILTGDGGSFLLWGYANGSGRAQYPGPTMEVYQGETVTVSLTNRLPLTGTSSGQRVSLVFPGQVNVTASCSAGTCTQGALTLEADPPQVAEGSTVYSTVGYSFVASRPGTYLYHSGTSPELQVELGLAGALIVRPAGFDPVTPSAYGDARSGYDREYLFFLSEMDPRIHDKVEFDANWPTTLAASDYLTDYFPNYWFINGRNAPDDLGDAGSGLYPTQPYNSVPRMHPGERLLMRVLGAGRDQHPFHHHGNHARVIAKDGRLLESSPGAGLPTGMLAAPDLAYDVFTIQTVAGQTVDAIFTWTGQKLGWDIYGAPHANPPSGCTPGPDGLDTTPDPITGVARREYCADHDLPFPVVLPQVINQSVGEFWSGSPLLGVLGQLPPGQGGMNLSGGYYHMWHSHTEKEITNFDIFPGGMMTFVVIESPSVAIGTDGKP